MKITPNLLTFVVSMLVSAPIHGAAPQFVPLPKSITLGPGSVALTKDCHIVAATKELEPLAKVLAGEIRQITGMEMSTAERTPTGAARPPGYKEPADIVLQLDPTLKGEAYTLEAGDTVMIKGATYQGVASGTVTLLQALMTANGVMGVPRMKIADEPAYPYRGVLIDLARKYHSPGGIEQVIELCRMYKVRYLHLHLSDDHLFMFPSTRFPQLGKSNQEFARFDPPSMPHVAPYTLGQLKGLESYAKERGVYLAQAKLGVKGVHDLYCKFITDMNTVVTKHGKKSIVWEEACNPGGLFPLPKDVTVMAWTHSRNPADMVKNGYQVINAMWTPLYIVRGDKRPLDFIFNWKIPMFGRGHLGDDNFTTLTETKGIIGTQMCSWENPENIEIQSMRDRLALVAEKGWNPTVGGTLADFKARLAHTDPLLDLLVNPISIKINGSFTSDENTFTDPLAITLEPRVKGLTLKYTLDNSMPNDKWMTYGGPITADKTVHLRAGLFDDKGVQQGHLVGSWFNHKMVIKPNLATGKPATAGPGPDPSNGKGPAIAVDGKADNVDDYWDGGPAPKWLQVDLGKVQPVNFINVITYYDGSRYYELNAEVSPDGKTWKKVLDFTNDKVPATAAGYSAKFPDVQARYVRVNMLKCSANPSVHIVELIVDETK